MTAADDAAPRDEAAPVEIVGRRRIFEGFRDLVEMRFRYRAGAAVAVEGEISREVLQVGEVAAALPYDPARDTVILLRQFRIGAHMARGEGLMTEIVAGLVDPGETAEDAARRELVEEAGVAALDLIPVTEFMPSPGFTSERVRLYCARVDSAAAPGAAGRADETEAIEPVVVGADAAIAALETGAFANAFTVIALSWLARRRGELRARWSP